MKPEAIRIHRAAGQFLAVLGAALVLAVASGGCTSTVTRETLMRKATRHSLTLKADTTYYCGSKLAFDYFYVEAAGPTTFRRSHWYRVAESAGVVAKRFDYTETRDRWRVFVGVNQQEREDPLGKPAMPNPATVAPAAPAKPPA